MVYPLPIMLFGRAWQRWLFRWCRLKERAVTWPVGSLRTRKYNIWQDIEFVFPCTIKGLRETDIFVMEIKDEKHAFPMCLYGAK